MTDFKALYENEYNYDSNGLVESIKTINRINRWSDDYDVQQYVRQNKKIL